MILVSACLAGMNTRYKGDNKSSDLIIELVKKGLAIPVCPEQLAGLATPRAAAECKNINGQKRIVTVDGNDVTDIYYKGASETLKVAKLFNCKLAILKEYSPSCGTITYDGTFNSKLADYSGVVADILKENDIEVISSEDKHKIEQMIKEYEMST